MSIRGAVRRSVAKRPHQFDVITAVAVRAGGGTRRAETRYGPFTGAFFDPTMAAPGGPNTELTDPATDKGWRLVCGPLQWPAQALNAAATGAQQMGPPYVPVTLHDRADERDVIDGYELGRFRVLKISELGGFGTNQGYRLVLERYT